MSVDSFEPLELTKLSSKTIMRSGIESVQFMGVRDVGVLQHGLMMVTFFLLFFVGSRAYLKGKGGSSSKTKNRRLGGPGQYFLGPIMNVLALSNTKTTIKVLERWCRAYGPVFRVNFGPKSVIFLNSPEYLQKLFGSTDLKHHHKGFIYEPFRPVWKDGLIISTGEKWRCRRKLLDKHMFSYKTLLSYMRIFNDESNQIVHTLETNDSREGVDVTSLLSGAILNSITKATVGKSIENCESKEPGDVGIADLVHRVKEVNTKRILSPWLLYEPIWRFHPLSKIGDFLVNMTMKQLSFALSPSKQKGNNVSLKEDLLGAGVPVEGIMEETSTLLSAGYETTECALQFLLFMLALHPHHQEKCREEIDSVFADPFDDDLQYRDLSKLKHLEMCVFETLRLFPIVFLIIRKPKTPIRLADDLEIPAGTEIALFMPGVHKNPEIYPNPEEFRPERFSPEESQHRHTYAYLPFSAGSRKCIGFKFAIMELMCVTAKLLRHFVISTTDKLEDVVILPYITLSLEKPINFGFEKRIPSSKPQH